MSRELSACLIAIDKGKEPDWKAAYDALFQMTDDECNDTVNALGMFECENGEGRVQLHESLVAVEEGWNDKHSFMVRFSVGSSDILVAGETSSGDYPESCMALDMFHLSPLAKAAGFYCE